MVIMDHIITKKMLVLGETQDIIIIISKIQEDGDNAHDIN